VSGSSESRAAAIIPVRVGSKRLPGKALLAESGQPLFLHTWQRACQADRLAVVYVATDSDEVAAAATGAGARVLRTSRQPRTGSERCAEAAREVPEEVLLNVQGDWPELDPDDLNRMADQLLAGEVSCNTLAVPIVQPGDFADPNVVKVVRGLDGNALYFSRAPIPHSPGEESVAGLRHIGVYGFTRETLLRIPALPSGGLAEAERLEQLQWLENGMPIRVLDAVGPSRGIETRADYDAFLSRLEERVDKYR
jgi:3-deoxy-manno-octulosonate cytidylyltransferase (CMP-KDO synthetase)